SGVGILVAGGAETASGAPSSTVDVFDVYQQDWVKTTPAMPAPRAGAVALSCGAECVLVALGRQDAPAKKPGALATTMLRFYAGTWLAFDDGLPVSQRRGEASAVTLHDGTSLIVGGVDASGVAQASFLQFFPGTQLSDPSLKVLTPPAQAPRVAPALALSGANLVIAGGQADGAPAVEVFHLGAMSSTALVLGAGPTPRRGSALVALGNGRVALLGGEDASGALLADGWLIDPVAQTATHVAHALKVPRRGHTATLIGETIVVIGGETAGGEAHDAEILARDTLASVRTTPMATPRTGHVAWSYAPGAILVVGGEASGRAVDRLGLYETLAR
ncbi:MAG: hypothetical protein KAI47_19420, partial [Deltaproteobacteria bacterium]|nr:hypothetical protein [Deltaproteobacteria bacterium]